MVCAPTATNHQPRNLNEDMLHSHCRLTASRTTSTCGAIIRRYYSRTSLVSTIPPILNPRRLQCYPIASRCKPVWQSHHGRQPHYSYLTLKASRGSLIVAQLYVTVLSILNGKLYITNVLLVTAPGAAKFCHRLQCFTVLFQWLQCPVYFRSEDNHSLKNIMWYSF